MQDKRLIIVGASARAAAYAAARSGFEPYWIDQFGDEDLRTRFPGQRVDPDAYPDALPELVAAAADVPFIYTGALENHAAILGRIESARQLLGNPADVCARVRDPVQLTGTLQGSGIPCPEISISVHADLAGGEWLEKSIHSAGGMGVSLYNGDPSLQQGCYLQQFIEGESYAAVYLANGSDVLLLGVTRQLTGACGFYADDFSYCGSLGPLQIAQDEKRQWLDIGRSLVGSFGLRGLFGVDAINREGVIYPVEVNPRYTASVEVIEMATAAPLMAMHCRAAVGELPEWTPAQPSGCFGKAYLFAPGDLLFPQLNDEQVMERVGGFPAIADVPAPGSTINRGNPVMTLLVAGRNEDDCYHQLIKRANRFYGLVE